MDSNETMIFPDLHAIFEVSHNTLDTGKGEDGYKSKRQRETHQDVQKIIEYRQVLNAFKDGDQDGG